MIQLLKVDDRAVLPKRAYSEDAGLDLTCIETKILWPHSIANMCTGWRVKVPSDRWGSIQTRSSTFRKRKLMVMAGVIDPNYTGPLSVVVFNPTIFPKIIRKGDRLAQLVIMVNNPMEIIEVYEMPTTERGSRGFGSSGKGN